MSIRVRAMAAFGVAALAALALALLVLAPAIQAAPDRAGVPAALQASQFEALAADGVPWYSCH
jgi:hypothetical protein